jgi:fimbrial chaperone protein
LPKDRESLFWMNVKAIPSVNKNSLEGKNVLQLAILSRIKLLSARIICRKSRKMPGDAAFSRTGNHLKINNPSAYYVTLVNLNVGKTSR